VKGPEREAVRRAFRRAAPEYAARDFLHAEIRARLLERLDPVRFVPQRVVDLGAGPPQATADIAARFPDAQLLAADLVPEMLGQSARPWSRICADAARLPLADGTVDMVTASMLLHWCSDPVAVLAEIRRVLGSPGLFVFATLGPDSLRELRAAWSRIDGHSHTLTFADMHDVGDALVGAGFADPVLDAERLTVTYRDVASLAADLRGVGAGDLSAGRRRGLTGRGRWAAMSAAFESGRDAGGAAPVTVEVVYGQAWASDAPARGRAAAGEVSVPLGDLSHHRRNRL
jgi:malonyl-CoA O-methyltransferase